MYQGASVAWSLCKAPDNRACQCRCQQLPANPQHAEALESHMVLSLRDGHPSSRGIQDRALMRLLAPTFASTMLSLSQHHPEFVLSCDSRAISPNHFRPFCPYLNNL